MNLQSRLQSFLAELSASWLRRRALGGVLRKSMLMPVITDNRRLQKVIIGLRHNVRSTARDD